MTSVVGSWFKGFSMVYLGHQRAVGQVVVFVLLSDASCGGVEDWWENWFYFFLFFSGFF